MRNHLVTSKQPLLNIDGTLREPGVEQEPCADL